MHITPFINMDKQEYILVFQVGNTWSYWLLIIILSNVELRGQEDLRFSPITVINETDMLRLFQGFEVLGHDDVLSGRRELICRRTMQNISKDSNLHIHCLENLKSLIVNSSVIHIQIHAQLIWQNEGGFYTYERPSLPEFGTPLKHCFTDNWYINSIY
jgi:hypothetical protein